MAFRRLTILTVLAALSALGPMATPAAAVRLQKVGEFAAPTYVTAPSGDHRRLFVTEREGVIRVMKDGETLEQPFLDISRATTTDGERGLLSMAFDPDYEDNRRFYVYFTDNDGDIRVERVKRRSDSQARADAGSRRTLVGIPHRAAANHNGGQIQFGPDGDLYAATGDGGSAYDPQNNAQSPNSMLGKLLRVDTGLGGAEIVARGLRNPYRFSFDRSTGALAIGDVGQTAREEVDFGTLAAFNGVNFGWKCREGSIATPEPPDGDPDLPCTPSGEIVDPIFDYTHAEGCSITGGYVVRDPRLTGLVGRYLFADFCSPEIRSIAVPSGDDERPTGIEAIQIVSFGEDAGGCLYTAQLSGRVSRLVPDGSRARKPC